jgi:gamma-glutamylaminecyclotransferase
MKHLVFVYGTLKQGHTRHNAIREQRYLGIARTEPLYGMYQFGGYPCLVDEITAEQSGQTAGRSIYGELYEVDDACMAELDKIEGVSHGLFERKEIKLGEVTLSHLPTNDDVFRAIASKSAIGYHFKKNLTGARDCGPLWTVR